MLNQKYYRKSMYLPLAVVITLAVIAVLAGCGNDDPVSSDLPELVVSPQTVTLSSAFGVPNLDRLPVKVDCEPAGDVAFGFSCISDWLNVSNLSGTETGITRDSFSIGFSVANLAIGTYIDTVMVASSGVANSPQYIQVTYTIVPQIPDLEVYPLHLEFNAATPDDVPPPDSFRVMCGDNSSQGYLLDKSADWLSLSQGGGMTPDTVVVSVDPSQLTTGSHIDTIWVSSDDMLNSPQAVACSLAIPPWLLQIVPFQTHHLTDVIFADGLAGWAVGYIYDDEPGSNSGYLIETNDGGDNWSTRLFLNADAGEYYGLAAISLAGSHIWTVGETGVVYYSPDLGVTFNPVATGIATPEANLLDVAFVSDQIGWIVGEGGLVIKTVNGGADWIEQTSNTSEDLLAVCFVDANYGWAVGLSSTLIVTSDGGDTWASIGAPIYNPRDVFFVDALNGWLVGSLGSVRHTSDGGTTWTTQLSGVESENIWLEGAYFASTSVGWVVGQNGTVLFTADGGETWNRQATDTDNWLKSAYFINDTDGWIVGEFGEIRYTTSGGNE